MGQRVVSVTKEALDMVWTVVSGAVAGLLALCL